LNLILLKVLLKVKKSFENLESLAYFIELQLQWNYI